MKNSLHVRLPESIAEKLEGDALATGVTQSEVAREVLGLYYGVEGLAEKVRKKAPEGFVGQVTPVAKTKKAKAVKGKKKVATVVAQVSVNDAMVTGVLQGDDTVVEQTSPYEGGGVVTNVTLEDGPEPPFDDVVVAQVATEPVVEKAKWELEMEKRKAKQEAERLERVRRGNEILGKTNGGVNE